MKRHGSAKFLVALAMVASSPFVAVTAQTITPENVGSSPLYFPNIDKNHDGFISRSELPKELHDLRAHFVEYDLDKDHRLSPAEYSAYLKKLAAGGAGACNSTTQSMRNPNCDAMSGLRSDTQPDARPDMGTGFLPPPPPPPTGGH